MIKKCSIRQGISAGILGVRKPKRYYQAQCGSKLKNFKTKKEAQVWVKKIKKR